MRKYVVAGNWKMNGSKASVRKLLQNIATKVTPNVEWIVFPPYPFLAQTEELLANSDIAWGAQNLSNKTAGAYTGEVSAAMLKDFGCRYVLVGHSERRSIYNESNPLIAAKFKVASDSGLIPILCVGETLEQREQNHTQQIVSEQINAILNLDNGINLLRQAIVAYEPVWAIGTGLTATAEQAQEVHKEIRSQIAGHDANIAQQLRILYGGSVKPGNAKELFIMPDIDGGLIGGASLDANDFLEIGKSCNN